MRCLDGAVDGLLLLRQPVEVEFRGGRKGFDDVFQGILVRPAEKVEDLDRHLGVRQELGIDVTLGQVLADGAVVREVAVVDEGRVDRPEGMGPAGMPDPSLGGEPLVGDPDMGLQVVDLGLKLSRWASSSRI